MVIKINSDFIIDDIPFMCHYCSYTPRSAIIDNNSHTLIDNIL